MRVRCWGSGRREAEDKGDKEGLGRGVRNLGSSQSWGEVWGGACRGLGGCRAGCQRLGGLEKFRGARRGGHGVSEGYGGQRELSGLGRGGQGLLEVVLQGLFPSLGAPVQLRVLELVLKGQRASLVPSLSWETDPGLPPVPTDGWHVAWPSPGAGRSFMQS